MPSIGLCLGAGGLVGQAYQAGVVATVEVDVGWDARDAAIVVGTSAGAVIGALPTSRTRVCRPPALGSGRPWRPQRSGPLLGSTLAANAVHVARLLADHPYPPS